MDSAKKKKNQLINSLKGQNVGLAEVEKLQYQLREYTMKVNIFLIQLYILIIKYDTMQYWTEPCSVVMVARKASLCWLKYYNTFILCYNMLFWTWPKRMVVFWLSSFHIISSEYSHNSRWWIKNAQSFTTITVL